MYTRFTYYNVIVISKIKLAPAILAIMFRITQKLDYTKFYNISIWFSLDNYSRFKFL